MSDDLQELTIEIGLGQCACGCGDKTNKGRNFVQGHDQRLVGILVAHRLDEVAYIDGGMRVGTDVRGYGARVFSEVGLAKLDRAIARAAGLPDGKLNVLVPAPAEVKTEPEHSIGAIVAVKVGRHVYDDAQVVGMDQAGKITAVEYMLKSGPGRRTKVAQFGSFKLV
jgi:hypothetical protein